MRSKHWTRFSVPALGLGVPLSSQASTQLDKKPKSTSPLFVDFLIIGGGTAGYTALRTLKKESEKRDIGKVALVSNEKYNPYMRPPLSKQLWKNENSRSFSFVGFDGSDYSVIYQNDEFYQNWTDFQLELSREVVHIDSSKNTAVLSNGDEIQYKKCLIATGGSPRSLNKLLEDKSDAIQSSFSVFRNLDDYQSLRAKLESVDKIVIVGGGYLGCELAIVISCLPSKNKKEVVQVIPESGYMGLVLPRFLSNYLRKKVEKLGVKFHENSRIQDVSSSEDNAVNLTLNDGTSVTADHVILAVGIEPDTKLATVSNLERDDKLGGFFANSELQTSAPDLWVAGDACSFYDSKMQCRRRVEHHDHAVVSGRLAAKNMLKSLDGVPAEPFYHQSMFWGDLGDEFGYEAIGIVDSQLPIKSYFKIDGKTTSADSNADIGSEQSLKEGVMFYMDPKSRDVVGILCWNVFGKIPEARSIIGQKFSESELEKLVENFL